MAKNRVKDMERKVLKLIIYMLNLIFGNGDESDLFWKTMLLPECDKKFGIQEALDYRDAIETKEEILAVG